MCEAFNNVKMEYRDKPIITMLEGIRFYISSKIVKLRTIMMRYQGTICPKIHQIIEENKKACEAWRPHWSGDVDMSLFEVSKGIEKFVVNLKEHTCSCRKWELPGILCTYSIACIWINGVEPKLNVISYYRSCFLLFLYCFWSVFGNCFELNIFWLHLTGNLLSCQHIHLLSFHVMDQTYGLLYKH